MTENPADIRREIALAERAAAAFSPKFHEHLPGGYRHELARAAIQAAGAHLFGLHLRLARAEADPTNNAQRKP